MSTTAASPGFMVKLKARREVAERTMAFRFEKPSGWTFKAGQFLEITLPDALVSDAQGSTRVFSIASSPEEDTLMVATRMRDSTFKRALKTLPLNSAVKIDGPFGNLTLHRNASRPAVLLTGGIGITPFRSIAFSAARERLPHHIFLFYSNRRPEDAAFLDELQLLERDNPNYRFVATMTGMGTSRLPWPGRTGYINWRMVAETLNDVASLAPIYYTAGPPELVRAMHAMLEAAGAGNDDIRTEEFDGY